MAQPRLVAVGVVVGMLLLSGSVKAAGPSWQALTNPPPFNPGAMFLLTDGTVMVQALDSNSIASPNWWRLAPDSSGSYVDGAWSQVASLPAAYAPDDFAAAVLPDGRLAIAGGEHIYGVPVDSNRGAIYDPVKNTWKTISPPAGGAGHWAHISDAPGVVLADGRWMIGDAGSPSTDDAILDPGTLKWTTTRGIGRIDANSEAGFTLLPSGKVLSVDVKAEACTTRSAEIFDPTTFEWSSAGTTPQPLVACGDVSEIGPQVLMYSGQVFVEGATSATALYDASSGSWSSGPDFPIIDGQQVNASDAGSALLPDGNVLVSTRTGVFQPPTHFLLFDGTSFTRAPENATSANGGLGYLLLLPTGQVLYNGVGSAGLEIFTDPGSPNPSWAPQVTSVPTQLAAGSTYTLAGLQLNGLSEGSAYGDDYQASSDYPLVQITNDGTGAVAYARTWGMTNRSIAPHGSSCTNFTLPNGIGTGPSKLRVIANGIASSPVAVTVGSGGGSNACPSYALSVAKAGSGTGAVTSYPAGIECRAGCSHDFANGTIVTLTPRASPGSAFAGWSGACAGKRRCTVPMTSDHSVEASFVRVCVVPRVEGRRLKAARDTISAHGCRVGKISHAFSKKVEKGHVISQNPRPGRRRRSGWKVNLVVSKGRRP